MSGSNHRRALERAKAQAKWMLERAIPFDVWLGMRPRTDGDIDLYHRLMETVREMAIHGEESRAWQKVRRNNKDTERTMSVTAETVYDERQFFSFEENDADDDDDDGQGSSEC